jgi:membrane fusion protein, multidrug efflux system
MIEQMDERTRRPGGETAPEVHPTTPAPVDEPRRVSRRSWVIGVAVLIGILLVGYIYRSTGAAPPAGRRGQQAAAGVQSVGAATVGTGDIRVIVNALGTVTPVATVTVQTQINGQLQQVAFSEGQFVKQGDFLAQVDPRPYQLLEAQYEGQLAHDQGLLAQARVDLERYQKLAEQNSIARQQYEDQVYIVQQYQGTVKLDQAQVDQQKLNVIYCRIVSPVTGRVGLRLVDPGNYVQTTTSTGLAVITQMQPITVIFPIPEDDLPDVLPTLNSGGTFQVTVYDRANIKLLAIGRVIALDSQIDTTTGTVKVRSQFENTDNALFPNQFVNAQLLVKTLSNVVTVPTAAIQRGAPGTYVYVINDGKVTVRTIKTGPTDGPMTAVTSGLAAGEQVVVDGTDRLRDGARVTVPGAAPVANTPTKNSSDTQKPRNSGSQ